MKKMDALILAILVAAIALGSAVGKPERPNPPAAPPNAKAAETKLPDLAGPSNWGIVYQDGPNLRIEGPNWNALGHIQKNGEVYLLWTFRDDGRIAPSLYKINGKELVGSWNWAERVATAEDGTMTGLELDDVVRKLPPPDPGPDL